LVALIIPKICAFPNYKPPLFNSSVSLLALLTNEEAQLVKIKMILTNVINFLIYYKTLEINDIILLKALCGMSGV